LDRGLRIAARWLAIILDRCVREDARDHSVAPRDPGCVRETEEDGVRWIRRRELELYRGRINTRHRGNCNVADLVACRRREAEEGNHIAVLICQSESRQRVRRPQRDWCWAGEALRGIQKALASH